jgi:hypothetical protein
MASAEQHEHETTPLPAAEEQMRRLRAQAALLMVIASLAVGFIVGRASVWLVPFGAASSTVDSRTAAVASATDTKPAAKAPEAPIEAAALDGKSSKPPVPLPLTAEKASPRPEPAPAAATPSAPAPAPSATDAKGAEKAGERTEKEAKSSETAPAPDRAGPAPSQPPLNVLNQGRAETSPVGKPPRPIEPPDRRAEAERATPDKQRAEAGAGECERRFSSFRRSDGTYQPFGSSGRARCPYLQ